MKYISRLVVLIAALIPTAAAVADEFDSLAAGARCAELAFADSVASGDREAFRALLARDARFLGARLLRGPEEILAEWEPFLAADYPRITWRPETVEILAGGQLALSRGPYLLTVRTPAGELQEHWGYYNSVWRRSDEGSWKIQVDIGPPRDGVLPAEQRRQLDMPIADLMDQCPERVSRGSELPGVRRTDS